MLPPPGFLLSTFYCLHSGCGLVGHVIGIHLCRREYNSRTCCQEETIKLRIEKSSSLISSFLEGDFFSFFFCCFFRGKAIPGLSAWSCQRNPRKSSEAGLRPFIPSQSYCFFKVTGLNFPIPGGPQHNLANRMACFFISVYRPRKREWLNFKAEELGLLNLWLGFLQGLFFIY